ncbi:MAG: bifunctional cytidylyltransferase/SDR family oxidoreductase, partial [Chlamydiae bacterium]|nr:bifunctional cytidylyltransferase/SDR family oxidoreductase [Chlamydiota bacterium]
MEITAILLAGGEGKRFDDTLPKQFHRLSGKKLYLHTLETFLKVKSFQEILLVAPKLWHSTLLDDFKAYPGARVRLVDGGATRQSSSYSGLLACSPTTTHVVIHDSVRPFVSDNILHENIRLAALYGACDTCIASHDTLVYSELGENIDAIPLRSQYLRGQTPQSFSYPLILEAHKKALADGIVNASDDCRLVLNLPHPVRIAEGSEKNIKITTELDLILAEQILRLPSSLPPLPSTHSLQSKRFAVTGATGGIGQALTRKLQELGALVIPLSRSSSYAVDLTSEEETRLIFSHILSTHGPLDGLINTFGYLKVAPLQHLNADDIQKLIATNFTALAYACKYCPLQSGAHILNLASSSYTRGRPYYAIYSGMKAAVVNFTQGLSLEYPHLLVNSLVPPRTNTPMRRNNFPEENP